MALMKSGWLWRQSSVFKRWKLNWCDLWIDGNLVCYKNENRREYETRVSLKSKCVAVKSGLACTGANPPEGRPRENLLVLYLRDGSTVVMCANSDDEALAWELTILEAKRNPVYTYDPYDDSYQHVPLNSHNTIYISPGSHGSGGGTHHILIHRDPCDGIGQQVALGMLAGMATGAALRSLLWMPFWFC
ncbi:pleckstrin homology domain-containing family B member 1 [Conger conger]|uniref:pleckstrin homology domain-containing family B member 1 n=1 Tax=Conger conger TaxID=82655 RepID=UPI002A5AD812|nr:pleckstrin homology domain-containing family B member 1 [Conger conger]